jgi:hypothetical protein
MKDQLALRKKWVCRCALAFAAHRRPAGGLNIRRFQQGQGTASVSD